MSDETVVTPMERIQALEFLVRGLLQMHPSSEAAAFMTDWARRCEQDFGGLPAEAKAASPFHSVGGFAQAARLAHTAIGCTLEDLESGAEGAELADPRGTRQ